MNKLPSNPTPIAMLPALAFSALYGAVPSHHDEVLDAPASLGSSCSTCDHRIENGAPSNDLQIEAGVVLRTLDLEAAWSDKRDRPIENIELASLPSLPYGPAALGCGRRSSSTKNQPHVEESFCSGGGAGASSQPEWLAWAESTAGSLSFGDYFRRVYGQSLHSVERRVLTYFSNAVPRRGDVEVSWKCFTCEMRLGDLWAPLDDAMMSPRLVPATAEQRCGQQQTKQPQLGFDRGKDVTWSYRACLAREATQRFAPSSLSFPGFFVHRLPSATRNVHGGLVMPQLARSPFITISMTLRAFGEIRSVET